MKEPFIRTAASGVTLKCFSCLLQSDINNDITGAELRLTGGGV